MTRKNTKSEIVILSVGQTQHTDISCDSQLLREVQQAGFEVTICRKIHQVFSILERERPCIVVIDVVGSEKINGTILASSIQSNFDVAILLFVGSTIEDRIFGLRSGADVCLSKPIEYSVVLAYLHAMGRRIDHTPPRSSQTRDRVFKNAWVLERSTGYLRTPNGTKLSLSSAEIIFLEHLFGDERKIFMRERLSEICIFSMQVKGGQSAKNLESLISSLRHKVSAANLYFPMLTLRGMGYQFTDSCAID